MMNEFVIMVVASLLLVASDPSIGSDNRSALGYAVNVVVSLTILVNQSVLMYALIKQSCHKCKQRKARQ